jgi:hypothetical protein
VRVEVGNDHLVEDAVGVAEEAAEVPAQRDKIGLQLGHRVLPQTPRAEADALAEGTDPALILAALEEIGLVLGLQAEGTELPVACVVFFPKLSVQIDMATPRDTSPTARKRPAKSLMFEIETQVLREILFDKVIERGLVRDVN